MYIYSFLETLKAFLFMTQLIKTVSSCVLFMRYLQTSKCAIKEEKKEEMVTDYLATNKAPIRNSDSGKVERSTGVSAHCI